MKAKRLIGLVETKSNYQNLNGQWVDILQFIGTVVYCEYTDDEQIKRRFDLSLTEIKSIKEI
jgi:hypothetical protein